MPESLITPPHFPRPVYFDLDAPPLRELVLAGRRMAVIVDCPGTPLCFLVMNRVGMRLWVARAAGPEFLESTPMAMVSFALDVRATLDDTRRLAPNDPAGVEALAAFLNSVLLDPHSTTNTDHDRHNP